MDRDKLRITAAFLAAATLATPSLAAGDTEARLGASFEHALGRGFVTTLAMQGRFNDQASRLGIIKLGGELDWKSASGITIGGGYDFFGNRPPDRPGSETHRFFEQIGIPVATVGSARIDLRARFDQRLQSSGGSKHHFRERLRLVVPLPAENRIHAVFYTEGLELLYDSHQSGAKFEQLRLAAGLQLPVVGGTSLEATYMRRMTFPGETQSDNVLDFNLSTRF